jgi:hypothetical protein
VAQNECDEFLSDSDHEARQVCGSSRSNGSLSAFCGWSDGGAGDRKFDLGHFALNRFSQSKAGRLPLILQGMLRVDNWSKLEVGH